MLDQCGRALYAKGTSLQPIKGNFPIFTDPAETAQQLPYQEESKRLTVTPRIYPYANAKLGRTAHRSPQYSAVLTLCAKSIP